MEIKLEDWRVMLNLLSGIQCVYGPKYRASSEFDGQIVRYGPRLLVGSPKALSLCVKRGGVRKMFQSAKTFKYIWSIGLGYDMFNLEGMHFPYFMATSVPFYGFFWSRMAKGGHR